MEREPCVCAVCMCLCVLAHAQKSPLLGRYNTIKSHRSRKRPGERSAQSRTRRTHSRERLLTTGDTCVCVCVSVCAPSRSPRKLWPPWPWGAHAAELGGGEGSGHLALPVVRHWLPVHDDLAVRRPAELDRLGGVDARRARVAGRPEPVSATAGASAAGAGLGARPSNDNGAPVLLRRRRGARADAGVDGAGDGVP